MKIKNVVRVMNFHSLLRVDSSKKKAEKYFEYEEYLNDFVNNILNNRNFILDKRIIGYKKGKKVLNVYIGNDLGFCGSFNSNVNGVAREDIEEDKIIIGKKIMQNKENVVLAITKEEYKQNISQIENILYEGLTKLIYREINIIYNHYYNITDIKLIKKRLLPLENKNLSSEEKKLYKEDFVIEGDINEILTNIIVMYLLYEIRIATENSYASENIMRQSITSQSLKKIDEIEKEQRLERRKRVSNRNFKKIIENFNQLKNKGG